MILCKCTTFGRAPLPAVTGQGLFVETVSMRSYAYASMLVRAPHKSTHPSALPGTACMVPNPKRMPPVPHHHLGPPAHAGAMHTFHPGLVALRPFAAEQRGRAEQGLLQRQACVVRQLEQLRAHSAEAQRELLRRC